MYPMFKQQRKVSSEEDNRSDVYTPDSIVDGGQLDEEFLEPSMPVKSKKRRQATTTTKRKKSRSIESDAEEIEVHKTRHNRNGNTHNNKKRVVVADMLKGNLAAVPVDGIIACGSF